MPDAIDTSNSGASSTAASVTVSSSPDWRAALPDDVRSDKSLESFKDVGALAKSFIETKRMVGTRLAPPKDDAPQEEWDRFYSALGRPETPDKYEITRPEGMPEEIQPDETMIAQFKSLAHKIGLTPKQVKELSGFDAQRALRIRDLMTEHNAKQMKAAEETLTKKWGPKDSPVYKRNLALARSAVQAIYGDNQEMAQWAEDRGNDPQFVELLHRIGEKLLEDGDLTGDVPARMSVAEVEGKIAELKKLAAYKSQAHPDHGKILDEIQALRRLALGRQNQVVTTIG